jgi:hypothetical protein
VPRYNLLCPIFLFLWSSYEHPSHTYLIARYTHGSNKIFARKLPVIGRRDWLLIYDDTFNYL